MIHRPLLYAVLVLTVHTAGAQTPAWKTWRAKACALSYPVEWAMDPSGTLGTAVMLVAPADSGTTYRSHVDLTIEDTKGADLQAFLPVAEQQLRTGLSDLKLLRSETERTPHEVHVFEASGRMDGHELHVRQVLRVVQGKAYRLTYRATPELYDEHLYLADAIQNSFTVTVK